MKKFVLIGAAVLIAGAATVAIAADHKGQKRAAHTPSAPAATVRTVKNPTKVATSRASAHKIAPAKAHAGKHHGRHPHRWTPRAK
jgi:hypothetical protein